MDLGVTDYGFAPGFPDPTVVETIAETASKSIVVPDPLVAPTPTTHAVHIKGCNLGKRPSS